jgi:hypothetical protein
MRKADLLAAVCAGLLVEATVERAESVLIPADLPLLRVWLQDAQP